MGLEIGVFYLKGKERVWFGFMDMNLGVWLLCGQGGGSIGVIFWWWLYFHLSVGISIEG